MTAARRDAQEAGTRRGIGHSTSGPDSRDVVVASADDSPVRLTQHAGELASQRESAGRHVASRRVERRHVDQGRTGHVATRRADEVVHVRSPTQNPRIGGDQTVGVHFAGQTEHRLRSRDSRGSSSIRGGRSAVASLAEKIAAPAVDTGIRPQRTNRVHSGGHHVVGTGETVDRRRRVGTLAHRNGGTQLSVGVVPPTPNLRRRRHDAGVHGSHRHRSHRRPESRHLGRTDDRCRGRIDADLSAEVPTPTENLVESVHRARRRVRSGRHGTPVGRGSHSRGRGPVDGVTQSQLATVVATPAPQRPVGGYGAGVGRTRRHLFGVGVSRMIETSLTDVGDAGRGRHQQGGGQEDHEQEPPPQSRIECRHS